MGQKSKLPSDKEIFLNHLCSLKTKLFELKRLIDSEITNVSKVPIPEKNKTSRYRNKQSNN